MAAKKPHRYAPETRGRKKTPADRLIGHPFITVHPNRLHVTLGRDALALLGWPERVVWVVASRWVAIEAANSSDGDKSFLVSYHSSRSCATLFIPARILFDLGAAPRRGRYDVVADSTESRRAIRVDFEAGPIDEGVQPQRRGAPGGLPQGAARPRG